MAVEMLVIAAALRAPIFIVLVRELLDYGSRSAAKLVIEMASAMTANMLLDRESRHAAMGACEVSRDRRF
jgi:hypothetical protein